MPTDVRSQVRAIRPLDASSMTALFAAIPDAIVVLDTAGTIHAWNAAAERMFGYTQSEAVGRSVFETVLPGKRMSLLCRFLARVENGKSLANDADSLTIPIRLRKRDGGDAAMEAAISRLMHDEQPLLVVAMREIAGRFNGAKASDQRDSLLMDTINHIPHFVFWKDRNSVYQGCNTNFARVAGCGSPAEIVGKTDYDLAWGREEADWYRKCDRDVMNSDAPILDIEELQHQADGKNAACLTSKVPLHDANGRVIGILGIYADITKIKQAEDAAEAANRAKSDFLANMSHEIRTPMTSILGYCEVLLEPRHLERLPAECADAAKTIHRNGLHLLELINSILDLSKVEAGRLEVVADRVSIPQLINEVTSIMRGYSRTCSFRLACEGPIPESIICDPLRCRQVLINLLGNAFKFTPKGEICLTVRLTQDERCPRLVFEVTDSGIGMTPEEVEHLFEPFRQADSFLSRRFGGSGLGLALSRRLARLLGGDVELVWSEPGRGSCFQIWFPTGDLHGVAMLDRLPPTQADEETTPVRELHAAETSLQDFRILLAEDGIDNQRLVARLLTLAGAEVGVAENGFQAVDAVKRARMEKRPYHVILMDVQMPVMDGYSATQILRKDGDATPVIAFTAHAFAQEREKCLKVGCNDILTKPIHRQELIAMVRQYAQQAQTARG